MLHFAGLDQRLHRTGELFDRHVRVDPVLVVQVDRLDAESLQGALDDAGQLVGGQHPPAGLTFGRVDVGREFGGDDDLVVEGCESFADQFLVGVWAVDLGGVEERDTAVDGGVEQ